MDLLTEIRNAYISTLANEIRTSRKNSQLKDTKLNYYSMMYIDLIYSMDDCTVNRLAEMMDVNKSTVSKKVDWLEQNGYVRRIRDEKDGRVFHIVLTDKVRENLVIYDTPSVRAVERIREELAPEEIDGFCKALRIYSEEYGRD